MDREKVHDEFLAQAVFTSVSTDQMSQAISHFPMLLASSLLVSSKPNRRRRLEGWDLWLSHPMDFEERGREEYAIEKRPVSRAISFVVPNTVVLLKLYLICDNIHYV